MQLWTNKNDIYTSLKGSAEIKDGRLKITNESQFRNMAETLAQNVVFNSDASLKEVARWIIWEASLLLGCPPSSIHDLYMARSENVYQGMTIPAINIRTLTFDVSRTIFKNLIKHKSKTCLFEIARSEVDYTFQRPAEYTSAVLAAAIAEGYKGPVCLQGDHCQVSLKKWKANPQAEVNAVKALIKEEIEAGFYNIDIDTSTLVDLDKATVSEQQKNNFETMVDIVKHVRSHEPKGVTISIGGEIGEVGGKNSTAEELTAYLEGVKTKLGKITGPSKISVQTGTSHGGVPLPDGTVAKVKLDFNCLKELGEIARSRFHIGGVVQHGASTLPNEAFDHFPKTETLEVHLATGFQNIIYDSKHLPANLKQGIYKWLKENSASEKKDGETEEQFYYKTRKKGFGPFKKELWMLPTKTKNGIMNDLSETFDMLFTKLGITGNANLADKFMKHKCPHQKIPSGL